MTDSYDNDARVAATAAKTDLPRRADDLLPPVEAPSAGFLLQLFFIPLLIVAIIVSVWAMFSWIAHLGSNPRDLVQDIKAMNDASWQKAYTLSDLLRNPDYDYLKEDAVLAGELATLLKDEIKAGKLDDNRIKLRIYLSRALGEFRVPAVTDALVEAAQVERAPEELDVRRTAVEALAIQASHQDASQLRSRPGVVEALLKASRERDAEASLRARADLRSSAAFALGVVGGDKAIERLAVMLEDPYANARYNAATGLARQGDVRAMPVLVEMLDPQNPQAVQDEADEASQHRKRLEVLTAGISAAARLADANPQADLDPLRKALEALSNSDVARGVRTQAREALILLQRGAA